MVSFQCDFDSLEASNQKNKLNCYVENLSSMAKPFTSVSHLYT